MSVRICAPRRERTAAERATRALLQRFETVRVLQCVCGTWLCGAWLCGAWLCGAWLCGAWLCGAWLCGAWLCPGGPEAVMVYAPVEPQALVPNEWLLYAENDSTSKV
jgi:hypothetical protein